MNLANQLQASIASYYAYYGADVADMLSTFELAQQKRIAQMFFNIVEDDLYVEPEDELVKITIPIAQDIAKPVRAFLGLYVLDKLAAETVKAMKASLPA